MALREWVSGSPRSVRMQATPNQLCARHNWPGPFLDSPNVRSAHACSRRRKRLPSNASRSLALTQSRARLRQREAGGMRCGGEILVLGKIRGRQTGGARPAQNSAPPVQRVHCASAAASAAQRLRIAAGGARASWARGRPMSRAVQPSRHSAERSLKPRTPRVWTGLRAIGTLFLSVPDDTNQTKPAAPSLRTRRAAAADLGISEKCCACTSTGASRRR